MAKVLVVVDMQNDFLTGVLGNEECKQTIPQVVDIIKNGGYDAICVTMDTHEEDYLSTQEGEKLPVLHCIKDTEGWQIEASVDEAVQYSLGNSLYYIEKDTFGSTDLGEILKEIDEEQGVSQIDFVGVCTGICVISNAIIAKANMPNVPINIIEKACACVTPESHKTAIEAMKTCQMNII